MSGGRRGGQEGGARRDVTGCLQRQRLVAEIETSSPSACRCLLSRSHTQTHTLSLFLSRITNNNDSFHFEGREWCGGGGAEEGGGVKGDGD